MIMIVCSRSRNEYKAEGKQKENTFLKGSTLS